MTELIKKIKTLKDTPLQNYEEFYEFFDNINKAAWEGKDSFSHVVKNETIIDNLGALFVEGLSSYCVKCGLNFTCKSPYSITVNIPTVKPEVHLLNAGTTDYHVLGIRKWFANAVLNNALWTRSHNGFIDGVIRSIYSDKPAPKERMITRWDERWKWLQDEFAKVHGVEITQYSNIYWDDTLEELCYSKFRFEFIEKSKE